MSDTAPAITAVRYPGLTVHLTGCDGNAFSLMAAVTDALDWYGVDQAEIAEFRTEATAGDDAVMVRTCMAWVDVR